MVCTWLKYLVSCYQSWQRNKSTPVRGRERCGMNANFLAFFAVRYEGYVGTGFTYSSMIPGSGVARRGHTVC